MAAFAAAAAVLGSVALSTGPANAAAADPPVAGVTIGMSPANGLSGTTFGLNFSSFAACPGDNVSLGGGAWSWSTFIVPTGTDIGALTFGGSGSPIPPATLPSGQTVAQFRPLSQPDGTIIRAVGPGTGDGSIAAPAGLWLGNSPLPNGRYQVGIACYDGNSGFTAGVANGLPANLTGRYYSTPITVTSNAVVPVTNPQGYAYQFGASPVAPVVTGGAVTATTAALTFSHANSTPASTYTVQVTPALPAGGTATVSGVVVGATSTTGTVTLANATTGQAYSVTVTASNGVLPNAVSNAVSVTPIAAPQPVITPTFTPGIGSGTVNIPALTISGTRTALPTSYTLTVTPAPTVAGNASFTIPFVAGPIPQLVNGLTAGTVYTFSLAPTYAAPNSGPQPPAANTFVTGTSNSAQVVQQRITVVRPVGQLILTQRCGVNGALDGVPATDAFPGFPTALTPLAASASQTGTAPDIGVGAVPGTTAGTFPAPGFGPNATPTPDGQFNNYPFPSPAAYPTECGVNLGTATIVSTGTLAGQYYAASGFINEVTVSDLRDTDPGFEVRGQMSNFVGTTSASNIISGNYLGWNPQIQNVTPPTATGYTQAVTAGAGVLPGTGVVSGSGLGSGRRLAIALPNKGLGVSQMDARLRLLIPVTAVNDTYTGIMNFTVVANGNGSTP